MKISILSTPEFNEAFSKLTSASLPPKTAFKIKKLALAISEELKVYEDIRKGIVEEYGERDESGALIKDEKEMVRLDIAKREEFEPKLTELFGLETTIEFQKISIEDLGDKVELTAQDLLILEPLISE